MKHAVLRAMMDSQGFARRLTAWRSTLLLAGRNPCTEPHPDQYDVRGIEPVQALRGELELTRRTQSCPL